VVYGGVSFILCFVEEACQQAASMWEEEEEGSKVRVRCMWEEEEGGSKVRVRWRGSLEAECICLLTHPCKGKLGLGGRGGLEPGGIYLREVSKCCTSPPRLASTLFITWRRR
jgi:hypothetical protein